jgi:hypothetical protein
MCPRVKLIFCLLIAPLVSPAWVDQDDKWVASRGNWWAFQPVKLPEVPSIRDSWVRTPIDAFILEALRAKSILPSPPPSREALIRRLSLDLRGLPPSPGEVDLFLRDSSPDAYEKLVDRLIASPHYGERWAVRWLDVVRYADTNGYELDAERPHAWRYRDYVVGAFNQDKPYDRFLKEQIAGDELYRDDPEAIIATGFHRAGPEHLVGGNQDEEMNRQEVLTEMTGAVGSTFLGLTIGCARCHNHKFDPIPQSDYYRLQAVLAGTVGQEINLADPDAREAFKEAAKMFEARLEPIKKQIQEIEKPYRERLREQKKAKLEPHFRAALEIPRDQRDEEQKRLAREAESQIGVSWDEVLAVLEPADKTRRAGLRAQMHRLEYERPDPPLTAYAVANSHIAPLTYVLKVGNHKMKQDLVAPGVLRVLGGGEITRDRVGRRSALARWLASPEHPLTVRVMANRIWQVRMGVGLVSTPNDFGVLGQRPTNAKLLDWLAAKFVAGGWSVKKLDRLILLSNVYRQGAGHDAAKAKADPDNKLYWRQNRRRLEAEFLRDSVLAVAGTLNPRMGGKPVRAPIEPEIYDLIFTEGEPDNLWPVNLDPADHLRRSLYLLNKRTVRLPFLANFDQPDNMTSCPSRPTSTHALQALSLLNSDLMTSQSKAFAGRLATGCGADADCRLRRAYKLALARSPRPVEVSMARRFLANGGRWEDFCLALLNRSEFAYVP